MYMPPPTHPQITTDANVYNVKGKFNLIFLESQIYCFVKVTSLPRTQARLLVGFILYVYAQVLWWSQQARAQKIKLKVRSLRCYLEMMKAGDVEVGGPGVQANA